MLVGLATQEAEVGELLAHKDLRLQWAITVPLHSRLGNRAGPCLENDNNKTSELLPFGGNYMFMYRFLCKHKFSLHLNKYLGLGLLGCTVICLWSLPLPFFPSL